MIDTHAHIDAAAFDEDRREVIEEAKNEGISAIIIPAVESSGFDKIVEIAENWENVYFAPGIHPHSASEAGEDKYERIINLASHPKARAIGEIGLDYYYNLAPRDIQGKVFRRQLAIAKELNLPVIIHNRDSDEDLLSAVKDEQNGNLRGVLHCFSGNVSMLNKALDCGMHVSFTGNITFKKSNLADTVKEAPLDKIMIETDSPYMTPVPFRGKRNKPSLVKLVAEKIAEIKSIPIEEALKMTTENAKKFFNILALLLVFLIAAPLSAQDEEEEYVNEDSLLVKRVHPYPKFFGIGPTLGTNTIVEIYKYKDIDGERKPSYPGILALGASVEWQALDYLMLEATYLYSKNNKIAEENPGLNPTKYQIFEVTSNWIANPYNRVNFFATAGLGYVFTDYWTWESTSNTGSVVNKTSSDLAVPVGLGFMVNVNIGNAGLVLLKAEWRLDFLLGSLDAVDFWENQFHDATRTTFFSIPRISVIFHPHIK